MIVKKILEDIENPGLELVSQTLDWEITSFKIEQVNWEEFAYKPRVTLRLAYNDNELFVKFKVREQSVRAVASEDNGNVWEDSCVELFISPECNEYYYNLEFSCIGKKLMGYRKDRYSAEKGGNEVLSKIRVHSTLGKKPFEERKGETEWSLTAAIPFSAFFNSKFKPEPGERFMANFYKCGDKLSVPHFLSWQRIESESPNFHLPKFFGELFFE